MRRYNLEVFSRSFAYKGCTLLDPKGFEYAEDAVDAEKNTVSVPGDLPVAKGDYIRITGAGRTFCGVVSVVESTADETEVTYSSLITLFDLSAGVSASAVEQTTVEDYIMQVLSNAFSSNSDAFQDIPGISFVQTGSQTYGTFDYATSDDDFVVIDILDDLVYPAFNSYYIKTEPALDVQNHTIVVSIGVNETTAKTIEADLPGVTEQSFVIKKANKEVNKAEVYDTDNNEYTYFYLHSDGTYDQDGDTDRIVPVINSIQTIKGDTVATKAIAAKYQNYIDTFNAYNELDRDLTSEECAALQAAADIVVPLYIAQNGYLKSPWSYIKETVVDQPATDVHYNPWISGVGTMTTPAWRVVQGASHTEVVYNSSVSVPNVSSVCFDGETYDASSGTMIRYITPMWLNLYSYDSRKAHVQIGISFMWGTSQIDPDAEETTVLYNTIHETKWAYTPFINSDASSAVNTYKSTSGYEAEVEAYRQQAVEDAAEAQALKVFSKNKYSNLIELTVDADNDLIDPTEMALGQECNIIHNGTSYNTLLTGREYKGDSVKLIFGTIRLELTKYLKGRY